MPISRGAKQQANPFDSDSDSELDPKRSGPGKKNPKGSSSYDEDEGRQASSSSYSRPSAAARNKYKNDFRDSGGLENQSVQELENYAAHKAEETTDKVNDCLKIAEIIREDASNTLVMLHQQGEQITRTHETCVNIDKDLSRGETLLGSLGGFFSKPWKAKKTREIKGPAVTTDDSSGKANNTEREQLGLSSNPPRQYAEPTSAMDQVQIEKAKQDDTLSDLSDVLGQLKGMAVDMGTEIGRQNKALDALHDDVDELNNRVKGANQRTRKLLGK